MTDRLNCWLESLSFFCPPFLPDCPFSAALFSSEAALAASCTAQTPIQLLTLVDYCFLSFFSEYHLYFSPLSPYLCFLPEPSCLDAASLPATPLELLFYWICWVVPGVRQFIPSLPLRFSTSLGTQLPHQGKHTPLLPTFTNIYFFQRIHAVILWGRGSVLVWAFCLVVFCGGEPNSNQPNS